MGSSSSKTRRAEGSASSCASSTTSFSSSSSSVRRRKSRGLFGSSCLGSSSRAYDSDYDDNKDDSQVSDHHNESSVARLQQIDSESAEVKVEGYQTIKLDGPDNIPCVSSNVVLGEWAHASGTDHVTRPDGSSSQALSGQSTNHSNRFLSRFSFVPGSVSFRLNRAASVGSSRAYPPSPTNFAASNGEDLHLYRSWPLGLSGNVNSSSRTSSTVGANHGDSSVNFSHNHIAAAPSRSLGNNQVISAHDLVESDSERTFDESHNSRGNDRQSSAREPVDRNVRFSRTLSVGRLRDRVLRRSSFSDLALSPLPQDGTAVSDENAVNSLVSSPYPMANRFYSTQDNGVETSSVRDARRNDLLEHRSNFLERRRRIRSQVRALQRLGSRFENLSGHERYCILSGQHRTGRCSCRTNTRESNTNEDGSARASISRIVMLAEALFEVLDEIHQQSVVLSSRPSLSSIGSVPAPSETVESLPVRFFTKPPKVPGEDVSQCYICLVEYEEGDEMRSLPCHHEFHKKCIDKWLKEIHRVCPLCRGDICRTDSLPAEN
ncbi:hypothetical protein RND81_06G208700 [Saponaria officinalis]|uniref:RING-type domain-containing protein n=1 Tax=Saponaria officinalis TaxID=3572 RepID=A0AAW1KFA4_SAPOF